MKATGVVRNLDELGRIVIPIEIRNSMDINSKDGIEIFTDNDSIILKKYEPGCVFCEHADNVTYLKGRLVCFDCVRDMNKSL